MEIDNEFRNYIRPLSAEEFEKLKTSVLAEGIRDPLVTWQGILLDGYHRYRIAQEYGLEYKTVEVELPDRDAAKEWILVNQLGRRNLTEQEASYYRGKLYSAKKQHQYIHPKSVEQNVLRLDTAVHPHMRGENLMRDNAVMSLTKGKQCYKILACSILKL